MFVEFLLVKHGEIEPVLGDVELKNLLLEKDLKIGVVGVEKQRPDEVLEELNLLLQSHNLSFLVLRGNGKALGSLLDHGLVVQALEFNLVLKFLYLRQKQLVLV